MACRWYRRNPYIFAAHVTPLNTFQSASVSISPKTAVEQSLVFACCLHLAGMQQNRRIKRRVFETCNPQFCKMNHSWHVSIIPASLSDTAGGSNLHQWSLANCFARRFGCCVSVSMCHLALRPAGIAGTAWVQLFFWGAPEWNANSRWTFWKV